MRSLALTGSVDFTDASFYKRAVAHRPADGGGVFPKALSTATVQYNGRQVPQRGMSELLNSYRQNPWLHKCLDVIGRKQAEVSWSLYARPSAQTGKRQELRKFLRHKGRYRLKHVQKALDTGELKEIENHPLLDLWENPNPVMGGMLVRTLWAAYLALQGEVFTYKRRDNNGIVYELWPIPPTWIYRVPTEGHPYFDVTVLGRTMRVPSDDLMWFKHPELLNPYGRGAGQGESMGSYIDTDYYAMEFQKAFFYNNARPNMMLFLPGASEDTVLDFQGKLEDATRGSLRAHRPLIYQGAQKIEVTEFDLGKGMEAAIPLLQHDRDTFASVFGVPPELMGILSDSNRATITVAETIMARNVTAPACEFLADELARDLVWEFDQGESKVLFTYENPVPDDADFQLEVLKAAPWAASANEWRKLGGLADRGKDGDFYMVPSLMTPTDDPSTPVVPMAPHKVGDLNPQNNMAMGEIGAPKPGSLKDTESGVGNTQGGAGDDDPGDEKKKFAIPDYYAQITKAVSKGDEPTYHRVTDTRTKRVIAAVKPKTIQLALNPEWQARIEETGNQSFEDMGIKPAFDVYNENIKTHLEDFSSDRITWVNDTTRDNIARVLGEGVDKGEGVDDLAARIKGVFEEASTSRARCIARTEVVRSSNFASLQGFKQTGLVDKKRWIGTMDDNIRDEHAELTEQTAENPIPIDDPFEVNGNEADAPGDFGIPEQDINCRCAVAPVASLPGDDELRPEDIADEQGMSDEDAGEKSVQGTHKAMRQMSDEARWKRFDKQALDWEAATIKLLRKAFSQQQASALAALRA